MTGSQTAPQRFRVLRRADRAWLGTFEAMASPCEVHVTGAKRAMAARLIERVAQEAWRIESKFSRYRDDNIIHAINNANGRAVRVDEETARLLDYAAELHALSAGLFDVTSGVLRRVWRFDGSDRVPASDQVAALLPRIGWSRVKWEPPLITVEPGMEIDLGGIGKEYAVDRAAAEAGAFSEACLLNFGGDLRALGPGRDARPWKVGIEAVDHENLASRRIELYTGALATSGDARRFLLKDGHRYSHILNPLTGWPVVDAPRSVTVAAPTCTEAGMLATFAMLQGCEAERFLERQNVKYWCAR